MLFQAKGCGVAENSSASRNGSQFPACVTSAQRQLTVMQRITSLPTSRPKDWPHNHSPDAGAAPASAYPSTRSPPNTTARPVSVRMSAIRQLFTRLRCKLQRRQRNLALVASGGSPARSPSLAPRRRQTVRALVVRLARGGQVRTTNGNLYD